MNRQRQVWLPLTWMLVLGVLQGTTGCRFIPALPGSNDAPDGTDNRDRNLAPSPPSSAALLPNNFVVQVVEDVGPAVVRINASRTVSDPGLDSFFAPFFGMPNRPPQERTERGTGSGFIFDADGLIMTNAHVVDQADQVSVLLKDGRTLEGRVLGEDPLTDIAVVKVEESKLPSLDLGNSQKLLPGEWAIAIGNPLGLDNTVTVGIISATGRSGSEIGIPDRRVRYIQTDAAINPGNSGGPLLNAEGRVIGVNTAIIQGAQGLGFAIPIDDAQRIAQQLVQRGQADHAYLGVQMVDLTPELRDRLSQDESLNVAADTGVLVVRVVPNSPAAKGGMEDGDIILAINDKPIQSTDAVQQAVEGLAPNDLISVKVQHQTEVRRLQITLGKLTPAALRPN